MQKRCHCLDSRSSRTAETIVPNKTNSYEISKGGFPKSPFYRSVVATAVPLIIIFFGCHNLSCLTTDHPVVLGCIISYYPTLFREDGLEELTAGVAVVD